MMKKNWRKNVHLMHIEILDRFSAVRKILGRHLTDFGVCVDRCVSVSPSTLRPISTDILERKQLSRPCLGQKTDSWTTVLNLKPP